MDKSKHAMGTLPYLAISIVTFLVMQSLVVVTHEFTHSTMAWILGEMPSPLGIVWGNPLTMTGWDEGVDYERIFAQGDSLRAAIIGFCPLIMHSLVVGIGIGLLRGHWLARRRWVFHAVYWLVVANIMELVAYLWMRAFSGHGDVGILDRATGLSPWWVFILGSALLTWALWLFFRRVMPRLQCLFAPENQATRWSMLILTAFLIFLWGSGIRVMLYVSGPQWLFGLVGVAAFAAAVTVFRPECNR